MTMTAEHQWTDATKRGQGSNISPDALFALLGDDEEVRRKVRLLVNMMLENAFAVLLHGSMADRTAMSRAMMPAIVKMMATQDDGGAAALRNEMHAMMNEMGIELPSPK